MSKKMQLLQKNFSHFFWLPQVTPKPTTCMSPQFNKKKLNQKLQTNQNKCVRFCLKFKKRARISYDDFADPN